MALLSPALVVAMSAMFVLTRLQTHFYLFERPLLFGLLYVLEPDPAHLEALDRLTAPSSSSSATAAAAAAGAGVSAAAAKLRATAASVPLRLTTLGPPFFPPEPQPYHRALSHTLSLLVATVVSAAFELLLHVASPRLLANARTPHLSLVTLVFALVHEARLSLALVPARLLAGVLAVLCIPALLLTHTANAAPLVALGPPTAAARADVAAFLARILDSDAVRSAAASANGGGVVAGVDHAAVAARLMNAARLALAFLAAALAAAQAVPARRITLLDAKCRARFARDDDALSEIPYEPARPQLAAMLLIAVDHAAALAAALLPIVAPLSLPARAALAALWAAARMAAARPRLQAFLFEAAGAYRDYWPDRAARGPHKAAETARRTVNGTSHFVFLIAVAHVAPAVATAAAAVAAVTAAVANPEAEGVGFVAEASLFLAWVTVAAYQCFAALSLATEVLFGSADEWKDAKKKSAVPTPTTSSERRKQRRLVEARMRKEKEAEEKAQ